jgi:hypothetical protein
VLADLQNRFPAAHISQVYAATEFGEGRPSRHPGGAPHRPRSHPVRRAGRRAVGQVDVVDARLP